MGNLITFRSFILLTFAVILVAGCGKKGENANDAENLAACSEPFIRDYNRVATAVKGVKADWEVAYGKSSPSDPTLLARARRKVYVSSVDCRSKASHVKANYNGLKCAASVDGKRTAIDVNSRMAEVINAMDLIPAY